MKNFTWLAPFVAALLLAGCASSPPAFSPADSGFSVAMPGTPQEKSDKKGTHIFVSEVNGKGYIVGYTDFGHMVKANKSNADIMLDATRNGIINGARSKLVSEQKIEVEGHPGRDLHLITKEGFAMHLKLILTETRLYQVGVAAPQKDKDAPEIDQYIDSFRFTAK